MIDYYVIGMFLERQGMLEDLLKTWDGQTRLTLSKDLIDRGERSPCSRDGQRLGRQSKRSYLFIR